MATVEQRISLLNQALAASTDIYKDNARILSLLDDKAQKTATLAGLFLAAAFASLRQDSLHSLILVEGSVGKLLLAVVITLLVASVFFGGLVIWAQKLKTPPDPNKLLEACNLLLKAAEGPTDEQRENHVRDQIKSWNKAPVTQDTVIARKSWRLLTMQILLLLAIVMVSALLAFLIHH